MRVALFGATGFVGSAVLEELLRGGHQVTALARAPDRVAARSGLTIVAGDASDPAAVSRVVSGSEAVISCLGAPRKEKQSVQFLASATRNIIGAMKQAHLERLVAISGAGITIPASESPSPTTPSRPWSASLRATWWRPSSMSSQCCRTAPASRGLRFGRPG